MSKPNDLSDGIYFGLDESTYHGLPRLSASGIKSMQIAPLRFWMESWMNPERDGDDDTEPRKLGRAYHKLILEGDAAFDVAYAVAPSRDDYPDALDGATALREKCGALGLKRSGTIAEMCERIREADPAVQLWPDIQAQAMEENAGREVLTLAQWKEIQRMRYILAHLPTIKDAFTCGYPEVSILWTDHPSGVPMKARMDYLKPRPDKSARIIDLKTFANKMDKPIELAAQAELERWRYNIQPPVYFDAWRAAAAMWRASGPASVTVCAGPTPSEAWLTEVFEATHPKFAFVFAQTGKIPDAMGMEYEEFETYEGLGRSPTEYFRDDRKLVRQAIGRFAWCMKHYGPDVPWIKDRKEPKRLRDHDFSPWFATQRGVTANNHDEEAA